MARRKKAQEPQEPPRPTEPYHDLTNCTCGTWCRAPHRVAVISFGLGGHYFTCASRGTRGGTRSASSLSGYENPETFEARLQAGEYAPRPSGHPHGYSEGWYTEGAIVIDKRSVLEEHPSLGVTCPMCSADITDDDEIVRCPEPSAMMATAMQLDPGNQFGAMLSMQQAQRLTSAAPGMLDEISPKAFRMWWLWRGARTGRIVNGRIVWDRLIPEDAYTLSGIQLTFPFAEAA